MSKFYKGLAGSGEDWEDEDDEDDVEDLREYFFNLFSNKSIYEVFKSPIKNLTAFGSTPQPIAKTGSDSSTNTNEAFLTSLTTLYSDWSIDQIDPCHVFSSLSNSTLRDNGSELYEEWLKCNSSSITTTSGGDVIVPMETWQVVLFSTLAGCTSLITVIGNLIVLLSFIIERSIRQPTNYFIASLAVSDLIIGSVSMPFYTLYLVAGQTWNLGPNLCDLWLSIDYTVCMASIYTVFCITIDRFCSVTIPAKYRDWRTEKKVLIMIAVTWIIPILVFFVSIFGWQHFVGERTVEEGKCYVQYMDNPVFNCFLQVGYFWITLIIMFILYTGIYRVALRMAAKSEKKYKKMNTIVSVAGQTITTIGMNIGHRASINPGYTQQNQRHDTNCVNNSRLITVASVTSSSTTDDRKASTVPLSPDTTQRPPPGSDPHHLHPHDLPSRDVSQPTPSPVTSSDAKSSASSFPANSDNVECLAKELSNESGCRNQSIDDKQINTSVKFNNHPANNENSSKCENEISNLKIPHESDLSMMNNSNCSLAVNESRRDTSDDDEADTIRLIHNLHNNSPAVEDKQTTGLYKTTTTSNGPPDDDPFSFPSPQSYRKKIQNGEKTPTVGNINSETIVLRSTSGTKISDKISDKQFKTSDKPIYSNRHGEKKSIRSCDDSKSRFFLNFRNREYFRQRRKQQLKSSSSSYSQHKQGSRLNILKRYFSENDSRRSNSNKSNVSEQLFRSGSEISKQGKRNQTSVRNFIPLCFSKKTTSIVITPANKAKKRHSESRNKSENRARKALRTITIILGAFVVCWTPWHVLSLIIGFKGDQLPAVISGLLYDISYWLCYMNSPINPFCYALANQQFKKAFSRILKLHWHRI